MLDTNQLRNKAIELLSKIKDFNEIKLWVCFGNGKPECLPTIYSDNDLYYYQCYERGECIEFRTTKDDEEALFWILDKYIMRYSYEYELYNRVRYVDNRRLVFETIRELYLCIGEPYYSMNENKLDGILKIAPFNDKRHRDLDLVDDFEMLAQELWNYVETSPWISYKVKHNLKYFIDKPYRSIYGGIDNFDEVFKELCIKFEETISGLENKKMYGEAERIVDRMKETKAIFS
ncbi:Imm63 family immunity protein [Anaerosporobacter sp.]|uniref:Imm63 family immunity protein n=1 Tax=Anaerosporobacter sp. TaxID=1872529 RepID=UPI00286EC5CC|nr:Imm63 family immunity protein [Anaerosporobacter sp.]